MENTGILTKNTIAWGAVLLVLFGASILVPSLILGGAKHVTLASGGVFDGRISQTLSSSVQSSIPTSGRDYKLKVLRYFDDKKWAILAITGTKGGSITDGTVVVKLSSGVYDVVLGPGTAFPASSTVTMPADLTTYLRDGGYLYDTVAQ